MLLRLLLLLIAAAGIAVAVREGLFWYHHVYEAHARIQSCFIEADYKSACISRYVTIPLSIFLM